MPARTSSIRFLVRSLTDLVFPKICFGCNEEIEQGLLCEHCRLLLLTSELDVCPGCGRPCADAAEGCGRCKYEFCLSRTRAVGLYKEPFLNLVHALKYSEKTILVGPLGQALAALLSQDTELASADCLCPVPLHPAKLRERGFNQSALLAREVAKATGIPLLDGLARVRNTGSQTRQPDYAAKLENVRDAFRVKPASDFQDKRVILVDDVTTTGSTLDAAARPLLAAGASVVMGLVVLAAGVEPEPAGASRRVP